MDILKDIGMRVLVSVVATLIVIFIVGQILEAKYVNAAAKPSCNCGNHA